MRRVVITGIGLVSPIGIGLEENWRALLAGQSGIGPITLFDASAFATRFAGEVKNFEPTRWIEKRDVKNLDRFLHFAVAAGAMAMEDAGLPAKLEGERAERAGC